MSEFVDELEFQKFQEASNYIQQFTKRLMERCTKNPSIQPPGTLESISDLAALVNKYLKEQQEFAATVEKFHETQKHLAGFVKENLSKCTCNMQPNIKNMLKKEIKLKDVKKDDGTNYFLKLPTTSSAQITAQLSRNLEAERQQRFDLEFLKMIGPPFATTSQNDIYHQMPHTSNHQHHLENGGGVFPQFADPQQFFDTSSSPTNTDKRKTSNQNGKSAKKRPHDMSMIGPYPCPHCDKTFRQKHGLSQHLLTHESTGAFECDGCGKRYTRQESVYRHQRSTQCCAKYLNLGNGEAAGGGQSEVAKPSLQELLSPHALFIR